MSRPRPLSAAGAAGRLEAIPACPKDSDPDANNAPTIASFNRKNSDPDANNAPTIASFNRKEGDLIVGKNSASAIGTLVVRTTRFTMLLHLPADHGALAVQEAIVAKMAQLPELLRQSLTWDRGTEMTNHAQIAVQADLDIYFCDHHSPWRRGSNENTNGLLRQCFAKGTALSVHGPDYLDFVAAELNNRPRKTLHWKTPAEALDKLLSHPSNPPGVALTG